MAANQQLALFEPIPLPDSRRPTQTQFLPEWLGLLLEDAKPESKTVAGQYRQIMTLPADRMPTQAQRATMIAYCDAVDRLCAQTPEQSEDAEKAILVITTKMLLALGAQKTSDLGSEAKGEAYLAALDDVPHWAVAEAVRGWYRGTSGAHDFRWSPAPAVLRSLALREMYGLKGRALSMRRLLAAEARVEFTEEHCATMREKLVGLMRGITGKPKQPAQEAAE